MPSLLFPDAGSRRADDIGGRPRRAATVTVYADAAGDTLAEIYADSNGSRGALIATSTLTTDQYGMLPPFWGPDSGVDKLWVSVAGGPVWPVDAAANERMDTLAAASADRTLSNLSDTAAARGNLGLGAVNNTSDTNKPISTATQAALDAKAPLASPAFTGTITGVTKAMVGLGSADNTSDTDKPLSAAATTALAAKVGRGDLAIDPEDAPYGAAGDGTGDQAAALDAAIADAVTLSRPLLLRPGRNYRITSALAAITGPLVIDGYGARITQATVGVGVFTVTGSDVRIAGLEIAGPDGTAGNGSQPKGVSVVGASAAAPVARVKVVDCRITGFRGYGVYAKWASRVEVRNCTISDIWYGGVLLLSCTQSAVVGCDVSDINDTVNAYGIIASRAELGTTLSSDPRCSDILIANNRVSDIPTWEGIDTHGGQRISIVGNVISGCKVGVAVGCAQDTTNTLNTHAPLDCVVAGNIIDSGVSDGSAAHGIGFTGASDSGERATGVISGNIIRGHGTESGAAQGAIYMHTTDGVTVKGNTILNPSPIGIALYHTNRGVSITGNTIIDPWTNTGSLATCIYAVSTNNSGTIGDNAFTRGDLTGKTVIGGEGIRVNNVSGNSVALGANHATVTTAVVDAGRLTYTPLARGRAVASTGSPEGVQTAPAGTVYENLNGGAGTTLYYKETGSGSTGWRQVAGAIDASATLDFGSIAAGGTAELTVTATGATAGDPVHVGPPAGLDAGLMVSARVSATNTVTIRVHNTTGLPIDPASATWRVRVAK